jgi:hypothetical protein
MGSGSLRQWIYLIAFLIILFLSRSITEHGTYGFSPYFTKQEIRDPPTDWINLKTKKFVSEGERSTEILGVDYESDGKTLNATVWLYFPFNELPLTYKVVHYGMLIDSDFDKTTGYDGIDYQLELGWDNISKTWNKKLEQWSPNGDQRTLNIVNNYSNFFEKGKNFILLSLDLRSLLYPSKYKVTFYAETENKNEIMITDPTRWVAIPPLDLVLTTTPRNLTLTPGESKTVGVTVNTTQGYEPIVNLSAASQTHNNVYAEFKKGFNQLQVPSFGIATTAMTITALPNATIAPYTLTIFANSSFPPEQLIKAKLSSSNPVQSIFPSSAEQSENVISQPSTMALTVEEPKPVLETFVNSWITPVSGIWTFVAGVGTVLAPFIVYIYNRKRKK